MPVCVCIHMHTCTCLLYIPFCPSLEFQGGSHAWNSKPDLKLVAGKIIGHRGEPTIVLLNGHVIKLPSKYLCGATSSLGLNSFFLQ